MKGRGQGRAGAGVGGSEEGGGAGKNWWGKWVHQTTRQAKQFVGLAKRD